MLKRERANGPVVPRTLMAMAARALQPASPAAEVNEAERRVAEDIELLLRASAIEETASLEPRDLALYRRVKATMDAGCDQESSPAMTIFAATVEHVRWRGALRQARERSPVVTADLVPSGFARAAPDHSLLALASDADEPPVEVIASADDNTVVEIRTLETPDEEALDLLIRVQDESARDADFIILCEVVDIEDDGDSANLVEVPMFWTGSRWKGEQRVELRRLHSRPHMRVYKLGSEPPSSREAR